MRFHTTLKLGPNREKTKFGFTIFKNVTIARTGEMIYGPGEADITPGPDGLVYITRSPEEVFNQDTLASFNGAPFTINHPVEDVTPENWKDLAHGFFVDVRRGSGDQRDEMVADLYVTTQEGIAAIDAGSREISAGYDADYYQTAPGRGEQRKIIGNHVAHVEAGRCGSRCSVKDHAHKEKTCMSKIWDNILAAIATKDEAKINQAVLKARDEEAEEETKKRKKDEEEKEAKDKAKDEASEERFKKVEDGIAKLSTTLDGIAKAVKDKVRDDEEEEKKKKEEEDKKKTEDDAAEAEIDEESDTKGAGKSKDSAFLEESFNDVKMKAEIIAPGVKLPTFDRAADPKRTFKDCICGLRRAALQLGTKDAETSELITKARGRTTDSAAVIAMSCLQVKPLFNSVAALKLAENNAKATKDGGGRRTVTTDNMTPTQKFIAAARDLKYPKK